MHARMPLWNGDLRVLLFSAAMHQLHLDLSFSLCVRSESQTARPVCNGMSSIKYRLPEWELRTLTPNMQEDYIKAALSRYGF